MKSIGSSKCGNALDCTWLTVCDSIKKTFRFTEAEDLWFHDNKVARLIAYIPFISKCDNPYRASLTHVSVYILAERGGREIFDHAESDNESCTKRLRMIQGFENGDRNKIEYGMNLLALIMLCGYERDRVKDLMKGNYNPLNANKWNYEEKKAELLNLLQSNRVEEYDDIMTIQDALRSSWN